MFSLRQAADMAGLPKRTFAELLGNYGVSIINYSVEDQRMNLAGMPESKIVMSDL